MPQLIHKHKGEIQSIQGANLSFRAIYQAHKNYF